MRFMYSWNRVTAEFIVQFCLARSIESSRSIETRKEYFSAEFSNSAQACLACRVLCFVLSIKEKNLAMFFWRVALFAVCVNLL